MKKEYKALEAALDNLDKDLIADGEVLRRKNGIVLLIERIYESFKTIPNPTLIDTGELSLKKRMNMIEQNGFNSSSYFTVGNTNKDLLAKSGVGLYREMDIPLITPENSRGLGFQPNAVLNISNKEMLKALLVSDNPNISCSEIEGVVDLSRVERLTKWKDAMLLADISEKLKNGAFIPNEEEGKLLRRLKLDVSKEGWEYWYPILCLSKFVIYKISVSHIILQVKDGLIDLQEYSNAFRDYTESFEGLVNCCFPQYFREVSPQNDAYVKRVNARNKLVNLVDSGENELAADLVDSGGLENELAADLDYQCLGEVNTEYLKIVFENLVRENDNCAQELRENEYTNRPMRYYLLCHGINYKSVDAKKIELVEAIDREVLNRILNLFDYAGLSCWDIINTYLSLFWQLNDENLSFLEQLISDGILTGPTLLRHLNGIIAFIPSLNINYELLKINTINMKNEGFNDEILFQKSSDLRRNLGVLLLYEGLRKEIIIYLLSHMSQINVLDLMIEKGIDLSLFMQIVQFANPVNVIKMILIAREAGMSDDESLKWLVDPSKFPIGDMDLDDYLLNASGLKDYYLDSPSSIDIYGINTEMVERMKSYRFGMTYVIGDVLISVPKFIRNTSAGDNIVNALTRGSILSYDDMDIVQNTIGARIIV